MATQEQTVDETVDKALESLGDDFGEPVDIPASDPSDQPATTQEAQEIQVEDDYLDREVPQEKLSGYWKNRALQKGTPIRVRDLIEGADAAEEKIRTQGALANTTRDENKVLRATLDATNEMLRRLAPQPQAPRAPSWEDVGMHNPEEAWSRDPVTFGQGAAQLGARIATDQINPVLHQLQQQVGNLQQQNQVQALISAAEQARMELNVDSNEWRQVGRFLTSVAGTHELGPLNPQAWKDAYKDLRSAYPTVEPRRTVPEVGIVRGNPMGSSRPTPAKPMAQTKGRVRGLVNATAEEAIKAGMPRDLAYQIAQETEAKLSSREKE